MRSLTWLHLNVSPGLDSHPRLPSHASAFCSWPGGVLWPPSIFSSTVWRGSISPLTCWRTSPKTQWGDKFKATQSPLTHPWRSDLLYKYILFIQNRWHIPPFKRRGDWPHRWEECQRITEMFLKPFFCLVFSFLAGSFEGTSPCLSVHWEGHSTTHLNKHFTETLTEASSNW